MAIPERRRREIAQREAKRVEFYGLDQRLSTLIGNSLLPDMVPAFREGNGVVCRTCAALMQDGHFHATEELPDTLCTKCWQRVDGEPITPREVIMRSATVIQMAPVSSSFLTSIGYDGQSHTLAVEFNDGHTKHYADVPEGIYTALRTATSVGKAFHQHVTRKFESVQVTGTCPACGDIGPHGERCSECGVRPYDRGSKPPLKRVTRV